MCCLQVISLGKPLATRGFAQDKFGGEVGFEMGGVDRGETAMQTNQTRGW
jgi:hypothetical protein